MAFVLLLARVIVILYLTNFRKGPRFRGDLLLLSNVYMRVTQDGVHIHLLHIP